MRRIGHCSPQSIVNREITAKSDFPGREKTGGTASGYVLVSMLGNAFCAGRPAAEPARARLCASRPLAGS
jgi:hypothetical protein